MKTKIILIGLLVMFFVSGCKEKIDCTAIPINESGEDCIEQISFTINRTEEEERLLEEYQHRCWEDSMMFCQRQCSERTGFIYSDLSTYDTMQFDTNNDGNFSEEEIAEWDYIEYRNKKCMEECIEEEVYDCFR